jgi:tetratricopeptide (TPR) repeat protein
MKSELSSTLESAERAVERGDFATAAALADDLVQAGDQWLIEGLSLRATANELWTEGPEDRLLIAEKDWRRIIDIAPASVAYQRLARVLLKGKSYAPAFECLMEASRRSPGPELNLGFAEYFRRKESPDLKVARSYYLRAAARGRTLGIRGYVEVSMETGKTFSAIFAVLLGLLATPFLALVLGERRHSGF